MKTAFVITLIIGLLAATIYQAEYRHPAALAALRAEHLTQIDALDQRLANSIAERDHLIEQLDKAQLDLAALATQLKSSQDATGARALLPASPPEPQPAPQSQPQPQVTTPAPIAPPAPHPADLAESQRLQSQLAALQARQAQVQAFDPNFSEQRIDPKTGKRTGIRTSDADRQRLEAQRAAELTRLAAEITTTQRRLAAVNARLGR